MRELFCVVICWQPWWHIASVCLLSIAFELTREERTYPHFKQQLRSLITLKEALKKECLCLFLMLQDSVFMCVNCFIVNTWIYRLFLLQVKRRVKPAGPKQERFNARTAQLGREEREELDFQFDEELDVPTGRHNTFTDWSVSCLLNFLLSNISINVYIRPATFKCLAYHNIIFKKVECTLNLKIRLPVGFEKKY